MAAAAAVVYSGQQPGAIRSCRRAARFTPRSSPRVRAGTSFRLLIAARNRGVYCYALFTVVRAEMLLARQLTRSVEGKQPPDPAEFHACGRLTRVIYLAGVIHPGGNFTVSFRRSRISGRILGIDFLPPLSPPSPSAPSHVKGETVNFYVGDKHPRD